MHHSCKAKETKWIRKPRDLSVCESVSVSLRLFFDLSLIAFSFPSRFVVYTQGKAGYKGEKVLCKLKSIFACAVLLCCCQITRSPCQTKRQNLERFLAKWLTL